MPEKASQKRVLIDQANRKMFLAITMAAALLVFSLFSLKSLWDLSAHRSRVISKKREASNVLKQNDVAIGNLITSFKVFEETPESVLGNSEKNSKIVLDALPPEYDFPALATSLEKILSEGGYTIDAINGSDQQGEFETGDTANPVPVEIPFSVSVSGPFEQIKNVPVDLERSIRPIHILGLDLSGTASNAKLVITAKTYYQQSRNLDLKYEDVR